MRARIGAAALAIAVGTSLAGCASQPSDGASAEPPVVTSYADYPAYDSPQEIVDAADVVARVTVLDTFVIDDKPEVSTDGDPRTNPQAGLEDPQDVPGVVVTIADARVDEVVKGDVAVGDVIQVAQLGGLYQGVRYEEAETTPFDVGGSYVLLMADHGPGVPYDLLHPVQAMYTVDDGSEELQPVAPDNDVAVDSVSDLDALAQ